MQMQPYVALALVGPWLGNSILSHRPPSLSFGNLFPPPIAVRVSAKDGRGKGEGQRNHLPILS